MVGIAARTAAIVAVLVLAAAVATTLIVASDSFRDAVVDGLRAVWRGDVRVGSCELALPPALVVRDLVLAEPGGGGAWLSVRELRIGPSWTAPFTRAGDVVVHGCIGRVTYARGRWLPLHLVGRGGGTTAHRNPAPTGPAAPWTTALPVESFRFRDGTLTIEYEADGVGLKIPFRDVAATVTVRNEAATADVNLEGKPAVGGTVACTVAGTPRAWVGQVVVDGVDLGRLPGLMARDLADFVGALRGNLSGRVQVDVVDGTLVGLRGRLDGTALDVPLPLGSMTARTLTVAVDGDERTRALTARLDVTGGRLTGAEVTPSGSGAALRLEVRRDGAIMRVERLELMSHAGQVVGSGFCSIGAGTLLGILLGGIPAYEVEVSATAVALGDVAVRSADGGQRTVQARLDDVEARCVPGVLEVTRARLTTVDGTAGLSGTLTVHPGGMLEGVLNGTPDGGTGVEVSGMLWAPIVTMIPGEE